MLSMLVITHTALAQYTNVINSNRPGLSESPYSIGTGVYQLETSLFYRETNKYPTFYRPQSYGVDFLLRSSFLNEKLEFNINLAYQNEEVGFQNIFNSSYQKTGISKLIIAAKYLVFEKKYEDKSKEIRSWVARNSFDWKRLIPSVAIYAGANTGIPDNIYKTNSFSPKVGVLLQNDLSDNFNIITNIFYDRIGTELPELSYIITATYSYKPRWSVFFENQTMFDKYQYQANIGTGVAFLFNRNLQLNSSFRLLADGKSSGFYSSLGASYRLDRHVDKELNEDKKSKSIKSKGFFGEKGFLDNLTNKFKNLFRKKGKRISTKKSSLKKETIQSINNNNNNNSSTNKENLEEKSLRVKPVRRRISPSKIKEEKNKPKKGFLNILKTRKKDEKKDSEKNTKELEKEIKDLEKEVKKDNKKLKRERKKEEAKKNKKAKTSKKRKQKSEEDDDDDDDDENDLN